MAGSCCPCYLALQISSNIITDKRFSVRRNSVNIQWFTTHSSAESTEIAGWNTRDGLFG